ncbi:MAG: adenylate/guanylate cyclase domain-containing protein [bacterium]
MAENDKLKIINYNSSAEVTTVPVKYIFLDIVNFTQGRSVEAQSDLVKMLNGIVKATVESNGIKKEQVIYLPTGDGICISLLYVEQPYDIHVKIAVEIIGRVAKHNNNHIDPMRQFKVRIGVNSNIDNITIDINDNKNIAGTGVNMCQRIMTLADGNQLMVGATVYEMLRNREKYMHSFTRYETFVKHNEKLVVFQFVKPNIDGLNIETPSCFDALNSEGEKLNKFIAYFFVHSILNRKFFIRKQNTQDLIIGTVLLWSIATDSLSEAESTDIKPTSFITWKAKKASFEEQFQYYSTIDMRILWSLFRYIVKYDLQVYERFFEKTVNTDWRFLTPGGRDKLKEEWPGILRQFDLL